MKAREDDRDRFFSRDWREVTLELPMSGGHVVEVRVNVDKPSFWNGTCRELIAKEIGLWLFDQDLAPWPKGRPPKIRLERVGEAQFRVSR